MSRDLSRAAGIEAAYYRFLSEFWRLSAAAPGKISFIREIEHAVRQVIRPKDAPFSNQLVEPFAITSMDWAGNISTFSPELLGLKNPAYDDFLLGNINRDALVDLPLRPNFARMLADIAGGRRDVPGALRVFQRVRRRRARQQARRERQLCQHRDDLLPSDQDARRPISCSMRWSGLPAERVLRREALFVPRFTDELSRFGGQHEQHIPPVGCVCRRQPRCRCGLAGLALAQGNPPQSSAGGQPPQYARTRVGRRRRSPPRGLNPPRHPSSRALRHQCRGSCGRAPSPSSTSCG